MPDSEHGESASSHVSSPEGPWLAEPVGQPPSSLHLGPVTGVLYLPLAVRFRRTALRGGFRPPAWLHF